GAAGHLGHRPPPAAAQQLLEVRPQRPLPVSPPPVSTIARTSTEQSLAAGMATAHLSASSRSGQSMIAYPPTCSRSSAAGPSVSSGCPSRTRTVVAAGLARRPGAELIGVAHRPDVRDLVVRDLEREHGHGDTVLLGHQAGLAVDRALQDRQAAGYPAGEVGQVAGHLLAAFDGVK